MPSGHGPSKGPLCSPGESLTRFWKAFHGLCPPHPSCPPPTSVSCPEPGTHRVDRHHLLQHADLLRWAEQRVGRGKDKARLQSPTDPVPPLQLPHDLEASGWEGIRTRRWSSKTEVTVKLPRSPKPHSQPHAIVHHRSPSPHQAPDGTRLAGWTPLGCGLAQERGMEGVCLGREGQTGPPVAPWAGQGRGGGSLPGSVGCSDCPCSRPPSPGHPWPAP